MHYIAYLDEFGHIGQFISRNHARHKTSPVFGLGGFLLPASKVRELAIFFYKLKCEMLAWELENKNHRCLPPYQWEKKGSSLYTVKNIEKYRSIRIQTYRLLNHIKESGGFVFFAGVHKETIGDAFDSTDLYKNTLLDSIRLIDKFCVEKEATFLLVLDHMDGGDEWRVRNVEACTLSMFEGDNKTRAIIEPPVQAESHLYQTLQCADWICGLLGRLHAHAVSQEEYADWAIFERYFSDDIKLVTTNNSHISPQANKKLHNKILDAEV
jgi:hypothetical protein